MHGKMPKKRRLLDYPAGFDGVALTSDEIEHFYDIIEVVLRIDATRKSWPHQFVRSP
jgi:hypothetical protein